MTSRRVVKTTNAPAGPPNGSQALICDGVVHCSGTIAFKPGSAKLVPGGIQAETRQVIQNLSAVLKEAGSSLANVIKVNIFLTSIDDYQAMNEVYNDFFSKVSPGPCRTCVGVYQLAFGAKVEMDCSAIVKVSPKL